ncbi:MAG: ATP-binding cassette domain-containing protein [Candidatus Rokuibacteriota bacterium]
MTAADGAASCVHDAPSLDGGRGQRFPGDAVNTIAEGASFGREKLPALFGLPQRRVEQRVHHPAHHRLGLAIRRAADVLQDDHGFDAVDDRQRLEQAPIRARLQTASQGTQRGGQDLSFVRSSRNGPAGELLERVRLSHVATQSVSSLSHGQQRQLEIGMALAGAPRLILFDEPAAGLSPGERAELVALLRGLPAHIGFVLIEHDLDIALRVVDRVTVMHNARVLKHGSPAEIENDAEVQSIYMGERLH